MLSMKIWFLGKKENSGPHYAGKILGAWKSCSHKILEKAISWMIRMSWTQKRRSNKIKMLSQTMRKTGEPYHLMASCSSRAKIFLIFQDRRMTTTSTTRGTFKKWWKIFKNNPNLTTSRRRQSNYVSKSRQWSDYNRRRKTRKLLSTAIIISGDSRKSRPMMSTSYFKNWRRPRTIHPRQQ